MQSSYISAPDGTRVEYGMIDPGAGRPVDIVMLHEGLGSLAAWKTYPEELAAATGCRVIAYSRRGYGRSSPLTAPRTVGYLHDAARTELPALLSTLGIRNPLLFGHSDGASIALIYAALPDAVACGVIALAPHVFVEDISIAGIRSARDAYDNGTLRERLAPYHDDVEGAFWGWNRIWLDPAFRAWNIEALLPAIRVPVLTIQGHGDEYGTLQQPERVRQACVRARLLALPDCRHAPHRDQPQAVIAATREFLDELAPVATGR